MTVEAGNGPKVAQGWHEGIERRAIKVVSKGAKAQGGDWEKWRAAALVGETTLKEHADAIHGRLWQAGFITHTIIYYVKLQ
ncbi:hypothetical protein SUGI_0882460 [Cryptomeria japonica]|nr:hypothetical protein SUGI_0882460 [Cryptomeria japonica]